MTTEAYPLHWPAGRDRTKAYYREQAKFEVTFARARDNIIHEVGLLTGTSRYGDAQIVISTNTALRRDGLPLAGQRQPDDTGVAVYFTHKKRQMVFACDRWTKIEHNMQAIAKTIEALRGIARWGTGDMLAAAFTGFTALPPPSATPTPGAKRHWRDVFGTGVRSRSDLTDVYRRLASAYHPDRGGDPAKMAELNTARDEALKEVGHG
ncbi:MAG: J domain-containing protein [Ramlibacter sp.]|nr:J domain-containing protein [Ramlibacter sp.]